MPARKKTSPPPPAETLPFEAAIAQLEEIVEAMEEEELPLESLVSYYEKGTSLLKHCEKSLTSAKKRIELITLINTQETPQKGTDTEPPRSTEELTPEASEDHNDIRLL